MEDGPGNGPQTGPSVALVLASVGITLCSGLALALVSLLMAIGGAHPRAGTIGWILILLPLPGAIAGSVASFATGRWWPFWVGLTLTCLPVILAILLAEPGHGFRHWTRRWRAARSVRPCSLGDDRLVAELALRLRDVDRALLSENPGAEGRHRWRALQRQQLPGRLRDGRHRPRRPGGKAAVRRLDALGPHHRGHELTEDDGLVVGDEVGLARATLPSRQQHPLDHVVDMGGVGDVAAAADPGPAAVLDGGHHGRKQGRIALAPDEPGPDGDGLESVAVRAPHREVPRAPSSPSRAPASPVAAAPARRRGPGGPRPSVRPRSRSGRSGGHRRPQLRSACSRSPRRSRARSPPMAPTHRGGRRGDRRHRHRRRPPRATRRRRGPPGTPRPRARRPIAPRPRKRARARTATPSRTRRSIRRPPMNPEPPVTNAVEVTERSILASK